MNILLCESEHNEMCMELGCIIIRDVKCTAGEKNVKEIWPTLQRPCCVLFSSSYIFCSSISREKWEKYLQCESAEFLGELRRFFSWKFSQARLAFEGSFLFGRYHYHTGHEFDISLIQIYVAKHVFLRIMQYLILIYFSSSFHRKKQRFITTK